MFKINELLNRTVIIDNSIRSSYYLEFSIDGKDKKINLLQEEYCSIFINLNNIKSYEELKNYFIV